MAVITAKEGKQRFGGPVRVFDGYGVEWEDLAWVDDETGEAEQYLRNESGFFYLAEPEGTRPVNLASQRLILPLPIRFEPFPNPGLLAS